MGNVEGFVGRLGEWFLGAGAEIFEGEFGILDEIAEGGCAPVEQLPEEGELGYYPHLICD